MIFEVHEIPFWIQMADFHAATRQFEGKKCVHLVMGKSEELEPLSLVSSLLYS